MLDVAEAVLFIMCLIKSVKSTIKELDMSLFHRLRLLLSVLILPALIGIAPIQTTKAASTAASNDAEVLVVRDATVESQCQMYSHDNPDHLYACPPGTITQSEKMKLSKARAINAADYLVLSGDTNKDTQARIALERRVHDRSNRGFQAEQAARVASSCTDTERGYGTYYNVGSTKTQFDMSYHVYSDCHIANIRDRTRKVDGYSATCWKVSDKGASSFDFIIEHHNTVTTSTFTPYIWVGDGLGQAGWVYQHGSTLLASGACPSSATLYLSGWITLIG